MPNNNDSFWGDTPRPRKRQKNKRKNKTPIRNFIIVFIVVLLLAFAAAAYYSFTMVDKLLEDTFVSNQDEKPRGDKAEAAETEDDQKLTLLLVGTDERENEPSRADTIIVSFIDKETNQVNLLSIPRDTRVAVPEHGMTKINHAHAYGGPSLLKQTVEDFLGIPVDYYAEVNFTGFKNIVDILGGLEMNVETRMDYPEENIDLYPGPQKLNGSDALSYVRWRGDGAADFGRMERQQKFLKKMASEALNITTVLKLPRLVDQVAEHVRTDMPPGELLPLAKILNKLDTSGIESATIPATPVWIDDVSYLEADREQLETLLDKYYSQDTN